MTETAQLEQIRLDVDRWNAARTLAQQWCDEDRIPATGLIAGRSEGTTDPELFGRQTPDAESQPVRDDAIFLVASITKPIVALAALLLLERGELTLGSRVIEWIPEFGRHGKNGVTLRNLLTHTSGLPDMLPNNRQLRAANAPLSNFVEDTCDVPLSFPAGRGVQYQSMGFAILGEIIQRVSGKPCAAFLADEIFEPLGMRDSALGAPEDWFTGDSPRIERCADVRLPPEQHDAENWHWNSRYWRSLGAAWGGLLTTPGDLGKLAQMMLRRGRVGSKQLFSRAAVEAATRNQLASMNSIPENDRRCRPWGLGWRLNWPDHSANFGDLLGPQTYGHWGATGTVMWIDPELDAFSVILTTQPQEPHGRMLARLSNVVASCFH